MSTTPFFLLAGFLVRTKGIPSYLQPLTSISYSKYCFESMVITLYGYDRCWYPEVNQTLTAPPWLRFLKTMTATMMDHNDNEDDLNYIDDNGEHEEDQALNDILALFSGRTVPKGGPEDRHQSMVMNLFGFTDDMLPYNCLILGVFALVMQIIAYSVFVWKLRRSK